MTLKARVIPCLDVKDGRVVKGVNFVDLIDAGDPVEAAQAYDAAGADELCFLDITASHEDRATIFDVVARTAEHCFMPLTVGGGVRELQDVRNLLVAGADKVAINTAAIARPDFLREAAETFGSQCIVLSVEAKKRGEERWEALTDNGRERTGVDVLNWIAEAEQLGAGEILVTSVDAEGTRRGFDHDLFRAVRASVRVPVIGSGGAGHAADIVAAVVEDGLDAIACASLFHYEQCPPQMMKEHMAEAGIPVRPEAAA